jgi:hypothetical protein
MDDRHVRLPAYRSKIPSKELAYMQPPTNSQSHTVLLLLLCCEDKPQQNEALPRQLPVSLTPGLNGLLRGRPYWQEDYKRDEDRQCSLPAIMATSSTDPGFL